MQATAAVCDGPGQPFRLEHVELEGPRSAEVLVRLTATGMCHTDISVREGSIPFPFPAVLGHEGAGIIEAVGPEVSSVRTGDHVVMTFPWCGSCRSCQSGHQALCEVPALRWAGVRLDGSPVVSRNGSGLFARFLGQSSFSTHAVVDERSVISVPADVPAQTLAPFGCGVMTGAGAILNVLHPESGESVAVFGAGAVGLSAVMAAALTPATQVVAVDVLDDRLALARELGATDTINAGQTADLAAAIRELTGGRGADRIVEATGNPEVLDAALGSLSRGGTLALVGAAGGGASATLGVIDFISGAKGLRGVVMGDGSPLFLRSLIDLHRSGRLPVDRLVRTYPFEEIEQAAADSASGKTIKPVLTFP